MHVKSGLIIALSLVVSGAMGNIIDCICYGRFFTDSFGRLADWTFNGAEGYAPWFEGRVVDMLYFPLVEFEWPSWVPRAGEMVNWGGEILLGHRGFHVAMNLFVSSSLFSILPILPFV